MNVVDRIVHVPRLEKRIRLTSTSVRFFRKPSFLPVPRPDSPKRGKINGFSRHSRHRLRLALANSDLPGAQKFGLCLTVPWRTVPDGACEIYRECFNRFGVMFRRRFPNSFAIFRHELQVRRAPHCHLVLWLSQVDILNKTRLDLEGLFRDLWLRSLKGHFLGGSLLSFLRHGIKLDRLDGNLAVMRYLQDHTSKSKQAQLGYKGRQWGFLNRAVVVPSKHLDIDFKTDRDRVFFARQVSRLCRFTVSAGCVFGSKRSRRRDIIGLRFVSARSCLKIISYMRLTFSSMKC